MKTSEALTRLRQYLADHGWIKHDFTNEKGECCILGAIHRAFNDLDFDEEMDVENRVGKAIAAAIPGDAAGVATWNDTRTDVKEVYDLIDQTAAEFAAKGD